MHKAALFAVAALMALTFCSCSSAGRVPQQASILKNPNLKALSIDSGGDPKEERLYYVPLHSYKW